MTQPFYLSAECLCSRAAMRTLWKPDESGSRSKYLGPEDSSELYGNGMQVRNVYLAMLMHRNPVEVPSTKSSSAGYSKRR